MITGILKSIGSKIWALLALAGMIVFGYLKVTVDAKKSARNKIKAEAEETAREYENAGSEAMISGLKKEAKVRNETINTSNRSHFE